MVSPSALAVLRLMTSSNFVGRSIGSSAGVVYRHSGQAWSSDGTVIILCKRAASA
jgi:hypothetical protein